MSMPLLICLLLPVLTMMSCDRRDPAPQVAAPQPQPAAPVIKKLSTETIILAGVEHVVELAYTEPDRQRGLMYRESLDPNAGMLFIFDRARSLTFHMENCLMDIDIVYIRATGQIDSIMTMTPPPPGQQTQLYHSRSAVKYALELAPGQAAALGLKPGDTIELPRRIKRIQPDP